jgi:hypothetical protein
MAHWKTECACPSGLTLSKRLGNIATHEIPGARKELVRENHFRQTDSGFCMTMRDRPDLGNPLSEYNGGAAKGLFKTEAYRQFIVFQNELLGRIFAPESGLKPTEQVAGYVIARMLDPKTRSLEIRYQGIADIMGFKSKRTVLRAIKALVQAGIYRTEASKGRYVTIVVDDPTATGDMTGDMTCDMTGDTPISETPGTSAFPHQRLTEPCGALLKKTLPGLASGESVLPSAWESQVPPPSPRLTGNQTRELIELHGYLTPAGMTISVSDLLRYARREGFTIPQLVDLIDQGFLVDVDQGGNVPTTDSGSDMFVAISELGRDTATWPDAEEELWPDSDIMAELNEQGELSPFDHDDDDLQAAAVTRDSRFESSDEWQSIRDVLEEYGRDGKMMTFGGIISGSKNRGAPVYADDIQKAIRLGFLSHFKIDGTSDPKGRYLAITEAASAELIND